MLEGLEITIFNSKDILKDNEEFRLDSEYYQKEYLNIYEKIDTGSKLGNITKMSDLSSNGSFAVVKKILNLGGERNIPFIRSGNCGETFINLNDLEYISEKSHINLPKSSTNLYDVMMARKGKIGGASIITKDEVNFNCSENVIKFTIKDKSRFNPFYFTVYFNSKYGLKQIERLSTGNVQPWVSIFQIRKLLIPELDFSFQLKIEDFVNQSFTDLNSSKQAYSEAENIFLEEIGLKDFTPSQEPVNIKSFKDSFAKSGRLDAEYYQKKYDDYTNLVFNYKNGCETIIKTCVVKDKNFKPIENEQWKYIELSNVRKKGEINGCTYDFGNQLPSRARRRINTGDVIISSIEGSLDSCALVTEEYNNGICSTGFYVISSKDLNSETLLILFKSEFMQNILKQHCSGTILTSLNKDDFLNISVPIIKEAVQKQIADLVEQSFALKKKSKQLLEVAKKAVELAIEENEELALNYINQEINE